MQWRGGVWAVVSGSWRSGLGVEAAVRSGGTWGCVLAREGSGGQWRWHVGLCALVQGEGGGGSKGGRPLSRLVRD